MDRRDSPEDGSMTFQDLGEVYAAERGSSYLTRLPDQFYEKASTYLKSLITRMENCTAGGTKEPDETYMRFSEEYRRSKDILERIYSTRERKIVLSALNSSRGINQSTEEMIRDEEELYFNIKMQFEDVRDRVLRYDRMHRKPRSIRAETGINTSTDDFVEVEPPGPTRAPMLDRTLSDLKRKGEEITDPEKGDAEGEKDLSTEPENGNVQPIKEKVRSTDGELLIVRAMKDVQPFVGPDGRTFQLSKEDIISLPSQVARILIEGEMVQVVGEGR